MFFSASQQMALSYKLLTEAIRWEFCSSHHQICHLFPSLLYFLTSLFLLWIKGSCRFLIPLPLLKPWIPTLFEFSGSLYCCYPHPTPSSISLSLLKQCSNIIYLKKCLHLTSLSSFLLISFPSTSFNPC